MSRFLHEGKAIDAVLLRIEKRLRQKRRDCCYPEKENHQAPVEMICHVGETLYAFEHTGIEPFEQHWKLRQKAEGHFNLISDQVRERLPEKTFFELILPVGATLSFKTAELRKFQSSVISQVLAIAPTLPVPKKGVENSVELTDLPFTTKLRRIARSVRGPLTITHQLPSDVEQLRLERIKRGYEKKIPKLAKWKLNGARTILIFEEEDIQFTNEYLIVDTLRKIEATATNTPDEIYLLGTSIKHNWSLVSLRIGQEYCDDFSIYGNSLTEDINPQALADLTQN